jgi:phenylacetate-CoA ligase
MGQVVCTGLQNTLQPLIRYRVGDVARWAADQTCLCKRSMPILEAIEGRFEDICVTPDGREMLRFDTVFKGVEAIREAQVVQEALDLFRIYVVPTKRFGEQDVEAIRRNMQLHAGNVRTVVETIDSIPRSSSGKFKAVVCNLTSEDKARLGAIRSRVYNAPSSGCQN